MSWAPPILKERLHSKVLNYVVEWVPLDTAKYGQGQQFVVDEPRFQINNLHPSSGHSFVFYSRSISGTSKVSTCMLIHFTACTVPDAPPKVEILKVTKNGLLLNWHPPESDNGAKVSLWEMEIVDFDSLCKLKLCEPVDDKVLALYEESVGNPTGEDNELDLNSDITGGSHNPFESDSVDLREEDEVEIDDVDEEDAASAVAKMLARHDNYPFPDMYEERVAQQALNKSDVVWYRSLVHRNLATLRK